VGIAVALFSASEQYCTVQNVYGRAEILCKFYLYTGYFALWGLVFVQCAQNSAAFFSAYACNMGVNLVVFLKKEKNLVYFAQRTVHTYLSGA
jgi:hypothetical protein